MITEVRTGLGAEALPVGARGHPGEVHDRALAELVREVGVHDGALGLVEEPHQSTDPPARQLEHRQGDIDPPVVLGETLKQQTSAPRHWPGTGTGHTATLGIDETLLAHLVCAEDSRAQDVVRTLRDDAGLAVQFPRAGSGRDARHRSSRSSAGAVDRHGRLSRTSDCPPEGRSRPGGGVGQQRLGGEHRAWPGAETGTNRAGSTASGRAILRHGPAADRHRDDAVQRHRGLDGAARQARGQLRRGALGPAADHAGRHRGLLRAGDGDRGRQLLRRVRVGHARDPGVPHAQRTLATFDWPEGEPVRVRMGVHTGHPARLEEGYVGMDLNRAARIAATAHGGQVVVSSATGELVAAGLPEAVELVDLGWHRLKDIDQPEHIFQLTAPDLPAEFPRLKSLGSQSSLPHARNAPGGARQRARGPAGGGPAPRRAPGHPHGTGRGRQDPDGAGAGCGPRHLVPRRRVLRAAGDGERGRRHVEGARRRGGSQLRGRARPDRSGAAGRARCPPRPRQPGTGRRGGPASSPRLLAGAPGLVVVATSRRPIHLQGEWECPVPPLAGPDWPCAGGDRRLRRGPALRPAGRAGTPRLPTDARQRR